MPYVRGPSRVLGSPFNAGITVAGVTSQRFLFACALILLFSSSIRAQAPPLPPSVIPSSPPSGPGSGQPLGPGGDTPVSPHAAGEPTMMMRLGYGGTYLNDGTGVNHSIVAGLDKQWTGRRSLVRVSGDASEYFKVGELDQSRLTFNVGAFASYQWSRRAELSVNERVASGYAWQAGAINEAKSRFPNVLTRSNNVGGALDYNVSPLTRVRANASYEKVLFDASRITEPLTPSDRIFLRDGDTFSAGLAVSRLVSHVDSLGISQQYVVNVTGGGEVSSTYTLHSTWGRPIAALYSIFAEGGVDGYQTGANGNLRLAPTGAVTLTRRTRHGSVSFGYLRVIEVANIGTHVSSSLNPSYNHLVGKNLTLSVMGRLVSNIYPVEPSLAYRAIIAAGSFQYVLPGNLIAAGSYNYFLRKPELSAALIFQNSSISLSYGKSWR